MKKLIIFFLSLTVISCSKGTEPIEEPKARTSEDIISDFKNLTVNVGVNDFKLETLQKNVFWSFRVLGPSNASENNKRPLVIDLHGASGGSSTAHQHSDCYAEDGLMALNAYVISPNAGTAEWYDQTNQQQILALLDLAKTNWHVDTNKVLVTGYSNGGNASWFYADFYPDKFTAAIAMASSYNPARSNGSISKIDIPLYVIHGSADELFPVAKTEEFVNASKTAGSTIEFVIADGLSHNKPCDYVEHLKDGVTWVLANAWN